MDSGSVEGKKQNYRVHAKPFHQHELDLFRIVGAVGIVLFHYTFRGYAADDMSQLSFPVLGEIFKYGFLGIHLFLIISGYTITLSAYEKNFKTFVIGRMLRLYPSFWIAVCVTTLAALLFKSERYQVEWTRFLVNLTMLSGFFGVKSVDGVYWFMFVLIRFYFLISLLILFDLMGFVRIIAGIWLFVSLAISIFHVPVMDHVLMPGHAPFLVFGMMLCSARKTGWDTYAWLIIMASLLGGFYRLFIEIPGFDHHYSTNLNIWAVFGILLCMYLAMYRAGRNHKKIKLPHWFAFLSACTYPLYLIHQNFGFMIFNHYANAVNKYILLILTFLFMASLAIAMVKYSDPFIYKKMVKILPAPTLNKTARSANSLIS